MSKREKSPPHCLEMALRYASSGFNIFPAKFGLKESHKSALYSGGINWGATRDPAEITRNFLRWRNANIGFPVGNISGPKFKGLFVIDCDTIAGHGVDGIANWAALQAKNGPLPPTRQSISPTGSVHSWFKSPAGIKIKGSEGEIASGVDVLGDGQMVIVPNSIAPIAKGSEVYGEYRWLNNLPIADAPQWLWKLCEKRKSKKRDDDDVNEIDIDKVIDSLDAATNDNVSEVKCHGLIAAAWIGSGGALEALAAFQRWSAKAPKKHNKERNQYRWEAFDKKPPTDFTVGTLYYHANETAPGWREAACAAAMVLMMEAYAAAIKAKYKGECHNG
jgi:hypothetical protein